MPTLPLEYWWILIVGTTSVLLLTLGFVGILIISNRRMKQERDFSKNIVDTNPALIIVLDMHSRIIRFNNTCEQIIGYTAREMNGKKCDAICSIDLHELSRQTSQNEKNPHNTPMFFESTLKSKDGKIHQISWSATKFIDIEHTTEWILTGLDITEKKKAEESLKKLSRATEQSPAAVIITDPDGNIEYVNPKFCEVTGYRPEEVLGKNPRILKSDKLPQSFYKKLWETITAGETWKGEFYNRRKDGRFFWENAVISPITNNRGEITHFVAVKEDITERKRAEEALRISEERYRQFFMEDLTGDYLATVGGKLIECNPSFLKIFGFTSFDEALDYDIPALYVNKNDRLHLIKSLEKNKKVENHETEMCRIDGRRITVLENVIGEFDDAGRLERLRGYLIDITERKQAEEALSKRAKQQAALSILGREALSGKDIHALMKKAIKLLVKYLKVDYAKVLQYLDSEESFLLKAGIGWKKGLVGRARIPAGENSQAGYTMSSDKPVIVENLEKEKRFSGPPLLIEHGVVSGISVVIGGKSKPFGVLGAHTTAKRIFSEHDVNFMQAVANVLAEAIERYQTETALRESEERLRTAMEKMPDGVIIVVGGRIIYANPAMSEITGYTNSELQDISPVELVSDEDKERVITRIEELVKGGKEYPSEYRIVHKSGFAFTIEAYSRRIKFNGLPALLSIIRDISERKSVEEELENYRLQLQNLSAHLQSVREEERTHIAREIHDELGQDLSVLKLNLAWLEKRVNENGGQFGDKINFMRRLIDETINKVREISRELRPSVLDNLGLSAAIQWQAGTYEKQGDLLQEVLVDCDDVEVGPEKTTQLFRIFQECMTNVIRHSKATKVKISLKEEKGKLVLKISDNGIGISREKKFNLKSLGLIGMHERVRRLNGNLIIRGIPNRGTSVIVNIPKENEV